MSVPNPGSTRVHFSRGASSRDSAPVQRSATSFEQFCVQIHHDRVQTTGKAAKGLQYICAPVAVAPRDEWHLRGTKAAFIGKHHRCKRCVGVRSWLGFDVDAGLPVGDWREAMRHALDGFDAFVYTTASHSEDAPRVRIVVSITRAVDRAEGLLASAALRKRIDDRLQDGFWLPLGWDTACDRAEQPLFLPPLDYEGIRLRGRAVDADALIDEGAQLRGTPDEPETPEEREAAAHEPTPGALFYLETLARRVREAPEGERNSTLFGAAADAAKCDRLSDDRIIESLEVAAIEAGMDPGEIEKTVRSGIDTGREQPRVLAAEDEFEVIGPAAALRPDGKKDRREIRLRPGESESAIRACEEALIEAGAPLYMRGDMLTRARPVTLAEAIDEEAPIRRPAGAVVLSQVSSVDLQVDLERVAMFYTASVMKGVAVWKRVSCPEDIALKVIGSPCRRLLKPLRGVTQAPALRRDGSLALTPGYDERTALLVAIPNAWPEPPAPTRENAALGLGKLRRLIGTFPFASAADESVALAALISGVLRPVLDAAPMILFSAPTPGTGKSLLAHMTAALATGQNARVMSWSTADAAENPKALTGALISGDPVIVIDNLSAGLQSDFLCSMLTEPEMSLRVLGRTGQNRVPCRALVLGTGNNASVLGDLNRRVLVSTLDAGVERPELRQFKNRPVEDALAQREELVNAVLTMARARIAEGPEKGPLWSSYGDWCWLVRDTLVWLGMPDPIEVVQDQVALDPERQLQLDLMTGWHAVLGDGLMSTAEILKKIEGVNGFDTAHAAVSEAELLVDALRSIGGGRMPDAKRLGYWLRSKRNRPVDGLRIVNDHDIVSKRSKWGVKKA